MRISDLLSGVDIFSDIDAESLSRFAGSFQTRQVPRGGILIAKGEPADAFYVVVSGLFEVQFDKGVRSGIEIGRGQPIGEIGFFAKTPRTAFVSAKRDSTVLELSRAEFGEIVAEFPGIKDRLIHLLSQRVDVTSKRLDPQMPFLRPNIITIVEGGDTPIPPVFVENLEESLSAIGSVHVVDNDVANLNFSHNENTADFSHRIERMSAESDFLILRAGPNLQNRSKQFVEQADEVLLIARASGNPRITEIEEYTFAIHESTNIQLVLLHDHKANYYSSSDVWLRRRNVKHHHHVAIGHRQDYDRLVRFLTGRATGLVACGGGAYCAAHIGVYKAFRERGVVFDMYGGTSGGAAMAAAFAMQIDAEELNDRMHDIFMARNALRHITIPRYSIVDHTYFDRALQHHYRDLAVEDLAIPFFAIATDLYSGKEIEMRSGPVWQAVRASASIPGLLPPFHTEDGKVLVDGSLVNNLPLSAMRKLKTGPNIAIDFNLPPAGIAAIPYDTIPNRWQLLRSYLLPFARARPQAPGLGSVIVRAMTMCRERNMVLDNYDRLILPPLLHGMSVLDWSRHTELMTAAYCYAKAKIDEELSAGDPVYRSLIDAP